MNRLLRWFTFAHLPYHLQQVSEQVSNLAQWIDAQIPEGAEKTAGLRKLLEAKDCFVRATIEGQDARPQDTL